MPVSPPNEEYSKRTHLSHRLLDDYFVGTRTIGELGAAAMGHLSSVCGECRRELEAMPASYAKAFEDAEERGAAIHAALRHEREELPDLLAALLPLGPTETAIRVGGDRRYAVVAFVEHELAIAWGGLEEGAFDVVDQALELAWTAQRRLNVPRYGPHAVWRLEAELYLAWARRFIAKGDRATARAYVLSAGRLLRRVGRPLDLRGAQALAAAELRLLEGRVEGARRLLAGAARRLREGEAIRWLLPVERLAGRIERLEGAPEAAVARLRGLVGPDPPGDRLGWSLARELILALVDSGGFGEAMATLVSLWGGPEEGAGMQRLEEDPETWVGLGWRLHREEAAEAELLVGALLRSRGRVAQAEVLLRSAREAFLRRDRPADAMLATVELLKLYVAEGDPAGLRLETADLDRFTECPGVPRAALRELTTFAAAVWRGRVGADLRRVERALLLRTGRVTRPCPSPHGPSF